VALEAILKKHMETWRPNPLRLVFANRFGRPMDSERIVRKVLRPILDELKIPRAGLHAFRHTHTSLLLDLGAPPTVAQAQLRHADPRITLGIYGHVVGDAHRLAVEKVAEALCPAPRQLRPNAPRPENHGE
jgi:integrase